MKKLKLHKVRSISGDYNFGTLTLVLGRNGCGKTTMLEALRLSFGAAPLALPPKSWEKQMMSGDDWSIEFDGAVRRRGVTVIPDGKGKALELVSAFGSASGPEKTRMLSDGFYELEGERDRLRESVAAHKKALERQVMRLRDLMGKRQPAITEPTEAMIQEASEAVKVAVDAVKAGNAALQLSIREERVRLAADALSGDQKEALEALTQTIEELEQDGAWRNCLEARKSTDPRCPVCGHDGWKPQDWTERKRAIDEAIKMRDAIANKAKVKDVETEELVRLREIVKQAERKEDSARAHQRSVIGLKSEWHQWERAKEQLAEQEAIVAEHEKEAADVAAKLVIMERQIAESAAKAWSVLTDRAAEWVEIITGIKVDLAERGGRIVRVIDGQPIPEAGLSGAEQVAIEVAVSEHFGAPLLLDEMGRLALLARRRLIRQVASRFSFAVLAIADDGELRTHIPIPSEELADWIKIKAIQ